MNKIIEQKLQNLKPLPGCYLMKNNKGNVIYVGKAKKLNNRVKSYFSIKHTGKTAKLVSEIDDFDYIIVNNDKEAFLLEINLIHQYNPQYNILLKDSKAYPYIELVNDKNPYLRIARSIKNKKNNYFGPYSTSSAAYDTIHLLNRLYPLRKCLKIPSSPCLYYHLNQCLAPCINKISEEDNKKIISNVKSFLNGNIEEIRKDLVFKMNKASDELNFEEAQKYKQLIDSINHAAIKQTIEDISLKNIDIFGYHKEDDYIAISTLVYRNGILKFSNSKIEEIIEDEITTLNHYIVQYYELNLVPNEIVVPLNADIEYLSFVLNSKVCTYQKGKKASLLKKAGQNAFENMKNKYLLTKELLSKNELILNRLGEIAEVNNLHTIELIDNSHLNGSFPVSSVVVFKDLMPVKRLYRKYEIKNDNPKDDLESMKEVIYRRFKRKIEENDVISDLLIVDGSYNQLQAAKESLDKLNVNIKIIGLFKDDKHSTKGIIKETGEIIELDNDKDLFFVLAKMQDEVHNNAISFHKSKRSKSLFSSLLDDVKGLGEKRKEKLLSVYPSIYDLKKASVDELSQYLPNEVAISLFNYLKNIEN